MKQAFRRMGSLTLSLLLSCALTAPALADVIWEPEDNDFYTEHREACAYLGRSYYVNGQAGSAAVCKEPGGRELASAVNGAALYVSFTYDLSGETWGAVEYDAQASAKDYLSWESGKPSGTGWVLMEQLTLIYDARSFEEEHGAEFAAYAGGFDALLSSGDRRVIVWTYPGSGAMASDFERLSHDYAPAMTVDQQWTDEAGLTWGHVGYYMGARGWVCLSDPGNDALAVTEHPYDLYPAAKAEAGVGEAENPTPAAIPAATGDSADALIAGVAAVCGVTGLLLYGMFRKKTQQETADGSGEKGE